MKRVVITTVSIIATAILATASFAQGRHDEKPHGSAKDAPSASEAPSTGGRHDEGGTTHAKTKKKAVQSKDNDKNKNK